MSNNFKYKLDRTGTTYLHMITLCRYHCDTCDLHMDSDTFNQMCKDKAFELEDGYVKCPLGCGIVLTDKKPISK